MMVAQRDNDKTTGSDTRSSSLFWSMLAVVVMCFLTGLVVLAWSDYRRTMDSEKQQIDHFAELFEEAVEGSLSIANLRMAQFIDIVGTEPLGTAAALEARHGRLMNETLENIPQLGSLVIIDVDGEVKWATAPALIGQNLSGRSYFQKARELEKGAYTVGIPISSRATGRRVTPVAWPLRNEAGILYGVVAASLGEEYFFDLLTLNDVEPGMHVEIITSNGEAAFISETLEAAKKEAGMISASRPISALGLNINVMREASSVLRDYWLRTAVFGGIASALFFAIIFAAIRARRQSLRLAKALRSAERDRRRLALAKREFDTIFENVGDGIVIYDGADEFHRSNRRARELLNAQDDAAAVAALRSRLPSLRNLSSDFTQNVLDLPGEGEGAMAQTVQCRVMKLKLHGADIAYCVLQDISEEQRLASTRSTFVTSVNHELRTPLTSLSGALDVIQDRFADALPPAGQKLIAMASRNAERLLVLVNDILTLQAIDQQQLRLSTEQVSVREALSEAAETNSAYGLNRGVSLAIEPPLSETDAHIQVDRTRLQQVFSNLISNAMKYSPAGGTVSIGAQVTADHVTFHVSDTGPGIPKAGRDKVFDRFATDVHSSSIQATGTGLGLAITRELVSRQSGKISLETRSLEDGEANPGTTFYISFPKQDVPQMGGELTQ